MKVHIPDVWLFKNYTPSKHNVLTFYLGKYALKTTWNARLLRVLCQKMLHMESQTLVLGPLVPGCDLPCLSFHLLVCPASWGILLTHHTCMDLLAHPFKSILTPCKQPLSPTLWILGCIYQQGDMPLRGQTHPGKGSTQALEWAGTFVLGIQGSRLPQVWSRNEYGFQMGTSLSLHGEGLVGREMEQRSQGRGLRGRRLKGGVPS